MQAARPDLTVCVMSEIQWDPDRLLVITAITTFGFALQDPLTIYVPIYTPTQSFCQLFDTCFLIATFAPLYNEYAYDCSNVYCGENAVRDCSGNYQSVDCAGSAVAEIPTLAQVTCERILAEMSDSVRASCNPTSCELDPTTGGWFYTCVPSCVGCDDDSCYESTLTRHLREQIEDVRVCFTDEEGNEACVTKSFVQLIFELADDFESFNFFYNSFECTADYNGQACASCTPCGVTTGPLPVEEDFDYVIDCSNIEAGSVWNRCDQTATGLWEFVYEADASLSCPGGTPPATPPSSPTAPTTESPTVSPRRGSPSQNGGGSDTANVGLIFGIGGALAGVLLLIGIGVGVYCCLQKNKDQDAQTHVYPGAVPAGAATETATPTSTSVEPEYSYAVDL
jgi:hypothetical protein